MLFFIVRILIKFCAISCRRNRHLAFLNIFKKTTLFSIYIEESENKLPINIAFKKKGTDFDHMNRNRRCIFHNYNNIKIMYENI